MENTSSQLPGKRQRLMSDFAHTATATVTSNVPEASASEDGKLHSVEDACKIWKDEWYGMADQQCNTLYLKVIVLQT
ncbi:hypothetical protein R1flu_017133 [Riccia fluitans]|uniref:Uncharacterized protein n=1 Tax=Riccia fluitans TaxID=41844 RepID=A0ABD1YNU3_9MARC